MSWSVRSRSSTRTPASPTSTCTSASFSHTEPLAFAEAETRVYLTISNDRSDSVSYGVYEIRIIADGQQIEQDSSSSSTYEGNYPELSYDISGGAKTSGILVFPAIEPGTAFKLIVPDIYCDDYETQFTDVELEIPAE